MTQGSDQVQWRSFREEALDRQPPVGTIIQIR
jgi:hypothetical protein